MLILWGGFMFGVALWWCPGKKSELDSKQIEKWNEAVVTAAWSFATIAVGVVIEIGKWSAR